MTLLIKNVLFTILVPGTVAVFVPLRIAADRDLVTGPTFALGCALLLVGATIYAWCLWDFATFGRGTPAPIDAPKRLVVRGLYRYTRNPMYVGVLTVILGWTILFGGPWTMLRYAIAVALLFEAFILFYEEPHLRAEFGDQYVAYCSRVARWFPGLR